MSKHHSRIRHLGRKAEATTRRGLDRRVVAAVGPLLEVLTNPPVPEWISPWTPEFAVVVSARRFDPTRLQITLRSRAGGLASVTRITTAQADPEFFAAGLRLLHGEPPPVLPDVYDPERDAFRAAVERRQEQADEAWALQVNDLLHRLPSFVTDDLLLAALETVE